MLERNVINQVQNKQAAKAGEGDKQHVYPFLIVVYTCKGVQRHAGDKEEDKERGQIAQVNGPFGGRQGLDAEREEAEIHAEELLAQHKQQVARAEHGNRQQGGLEYLFAGQAEAHVFRRTAQLAAHGEEYRQIQRQRNKASDDIQQENAVHTWHGKHIAGRQHDRHRAALRRDVDGIPHKPVIQKRRGQQPSFLRWQK